MTQRSQLEITAYHEAGHAVMAMSCGFHVTEISIEVSENGQGHTAWQTPMSMAVAARVGIIMTLASGMAADYLHCKSLYGEDRQEALLGYKGDEQDANIHLSEIGQEWAFEYYVGLALRHLKQDEVWQYVKQIAELLKESRLINGRETLHRVAQQIPKIPAQTLETYKFIVEDMYKLEQIHAERN